MKYISIQKLNTKIINLKITNNKLLVENKTQLDATEWFIALMICSTCFENFYAHHQELETTCVFLSPMVCGAWLLVVRGQVPGSRLCVQKEGCCKCNIPQVLFGQSITSISIIFGNIVSFFNVWATFTPPVWKSARFSLLRSNFPHQIMKHIITLKNKNSYK